MSINVGTPKDLKKLEQLIREMQQATSENLTSDVELTPLEEKLERVKLREDGRKAAGRRRAKANRAKRLKKAENARGVHRRKVRRWEAALNGDWYPIMYRRWVQKGFNIEISPANWRKHVEPHLPVDEVITVRRYNSKDNTISLGRIYVTAEFDKTRVYFDGKEYALAKAGYTTED